ncbi:hypothetical protein E9549_02420 [Blastococcus sp. MG754426]|nr:MULTISPECIES: hypothetical protein [unclassified Blastococcus]MCF6506265.1 hypothetical protein [Blastococcus sp. MG754426]MCF6510919.1 hypothetical protein [Blastococcus sp. MG754427]MCF6733885.1 hypothetical protein [Blastococcus sp. KM273129]
MSMMDPLDPFSGREADDGIPAADPGAGAPPTAEGFGEPGGAPDPPEETAGTPADPAGSPVDVAGQDAGSADDPGFRTPDPHDVGPTTEN